MDMVLDPTSWLQIGGLHFPLQRSLSTIQAEQHEA
jgi:hypothetical protein